MDYAQEESALGAKMALAQAQQTQGILGGQYSNRAVASRALDRCIAESHVIGEQAAQAAKLADTILERLAGPRAEACGDEQTAKDGSNGGAIGQIERLQSGTISSLADLRRTLELIGNYV